jgi:hypothetical protein
MQKRKLFLLLCSLALASVLCKRQTAAPNLIPQKSMAQVGDIAFDPAVDRADFHLCRKTERLPQYYGTGAAYEGGGRAMAEEILLKFRPVSRAAKQSGYITIRFVLNCRGETDRFRVFQVDRNYKNTQFHPDLIAQLSDAVRALRNWKPGRYDNGEPLDCYYTVWFKIRDGKVTEVLP